MTRFLYNLVRLALFLLALSFLSFYLTAEQGLNQEWLLTLVDAATKYVPELLWPVTIAMVVLLLLRWMGKDEEEQLGFEDFFAGLLALAVHLGVILVWRAQGHEIVGGFVSNIPDVEQLTQHAGAIGTLGVAGLEFAAFGLYVIAGPDKE